MAEPLQRVLAALEAHDCGPKQSGSSWKARCPAHEDDTPSLSVSEGEDGRAVLYCHAGCETTAVVAALGLEMRDLFAEPSANGFKPEIVETYNYTDESGELLYQTVRYHNPKDFRQRRPDGAGGWMWNLHDTRRVLYRLP